MMNIDKNQSYILAFEDKSYYVFVVPQNEAIENDEVVAVTAALGIRIEGYTDEQGELL